MARLVGVDLPRDKRLEVALTYVYGIGHTRALETLQATELNADTRVHDLSDDQLDALMAELDGLDALPSAEPETHLTPILPPDGGHGAP